MLIAIVVMALVVAFSGCDAGLEIMGMEVVSYPDNIVYYAGHDTALDLSGGQVNFLLKQGTKHLVEMTDTRIECHSDVDFSKPGVYVVELNCHNDGYISFPVQVIDEPSGEAAGQ